MFGPFFNIFVLLHVQHCSVYVINSDAEYSSVVSARFIDASMHRDTCHAIRIAIQFAIVFLACDFRGPGQT